MNFHLSGPLPDLPVAQLRGIISNQITDLIDLLDALDGDCDLEDGGDTEPSLGWSKQGPQTETRRTLDDLELDLADDEDGGDHEPTLGAGEGHPSVYGGGRGNGCQSWWGYADTRSRLDECESEDEHGGDVLDGPHDGEDEGNDEPDLGWESAGTQFGIGLNGWSQSDPAGNVGGGSLFFEGEGSREARSMLRGLPRYQDRLLATVDTVVPLGRVPGGNVGEWVRGRT